MGMVAYYLHGGGHVTHVSGAAARLGRSPASTRSVLKGSAGLAGIKIPIVTRIVSGTPAAMILCTWPLWCAQTSFAQIPVTRLLCNAPAAFDVIGLVSTLLGLVFAFDHLGFSLQPAPPRAQPFFQTLLS